MPSLSSNNCRRIVHRCKQATLLRLLVDLEKAFDHVSRNILWWALKIFRDKEWVVRAIQSMNTNVRSRVRVNGQYSEELGVGVGVH